MLYEERDLILETIVNVLEVADYVKYTEINHIEQTKFILEGQSEDVTLTDKNWQEMIKLIAKLIPKMYSNIHKILQVTKQEMIYNMNYA